jgi:hypothetical protein
MLSFPVRTNDAFLDSVIDILLVVLRTCSCTSFSFLSACGHIRYRYCCLFECIAPRRNRKPSFSCALKTFPLSTHGEDSLIDIVDTVSLTHIVTCHDDNHMVSLINGLTFPHVVSTFHALIHMIPSHRGQVAQGARGRGQ